MPAKRLRPLPAFIFLSRWLQLPLYQGLIAAQGVYVITFLRVFIDTAQRTTHQLLWQTVIHIAFIVSAVAMALIERIMPQPELSSH